MNVNKILRLLLIFCLLVGASLDARLVGALGFVSPAYPDFGRYRPSQDTFEFFEDFISEAYFTYSDAGVAVVNKLNIRREEIQFKDIELDGTFLIPSRENKKKIDYFYKRRSFEFYRQVAQSNKVDMILYSKFSRTKLKRTLRSKSNPATLVYRIFVYDVQSSATKSEYIMLKVKDLFTLPDYDVEQLQTDFIENYIKIFQELVGHMQVIGSAYDKSATSQASVHSSSEQQETSTDSESSDGGDW